MSLTGSTVRSVANTVVAVHPRRRVRIRWSVPSSRSHPYRRSKRHGRGHGQDSKSSLHSYLPIALRPLIAITQVQTAQETECYPSSCWDTAHIRQYGRSTEGVHERNLTRQPRRSSARTLRHLPVPQQHQQPPICAGHGRAGTKVVQPPTALVRHNLGSASIGAYGWMRNRPRPPIMPDMGGVSASWVGMAPVVGDFGSRGLPNLGWRWRFRFFEEV
jgi:hypothetical protein